MKKIIAILLGIFILIPSSAAALTTTSPVWYQGLSGDQTLAVGDDILIYAQVDNATKAPITYTISFTANDKVIGSKVTTVPEYAQQASAITWTLPETPTVVTAAVVKAVGKDKKEIVSLKGVIGTVRIGSGKQLEVPAIDGKVKGFVGIWLGHIEAWRVKQFEYFTNLKTQSKGVVGETTVNDISGLLKPETPAAPGEEVQPEQQVDDAQMIGYGKLLYATAGAYFFGHKALFYVAGILIVVFVLRFIFKRFF